MPSERDAGVLRDILRHVDYAQEFVRGIDRASFDHDAMRQFAVVRCLEIISEASRRLSDDIKRRNVDIPWKEIAAAGNVYRHAYEDVSPARVWDTVEWSLPVLRGAIERELSK